MTILTPFTLVFLVCIACAILLIIALIATRHQSELSQNVFEDCKHENVITRVLEVSGTCETTVDVCADCGKPLSHPKTDFKV